MGIPRRLSKGRNVSLQSVGNGQASGIIGAAINAGTRRQLKEGTLQAAAGNSQLALRGK